MTMTTTAMMTKGTTVGSTIAFIRDTCGAPVLERVLGALPAATRAALEGVSPTGELPYEMLIALWTAADAVLAERDPQWIERSGGHSIGSTGAQLYGGIVRKPTPSQFLTQGVSLFRLYYHPGDMEVVEQRQGHAVLRLVGFEAGTRLFCRRQTGGLLTALALAGGASPAVHHVRCVADGDAFCEWALDWTEEQPARKSDPKGLTVVEG